MLYTVQHVFFAIRHIKSVMTKRSMIMKKKIRLSIIVLLGIFLILGGSIVQAQAQTYSVKIDEYGTGLKTYPNNVWSSWNGQVLFDPTTGNQSLIYFGARATTFTNFRDILVKDINGADSDIVRFYTPTAADAPEDPDYLQHTWVIFYSADTSGGAPADTGLPVTRNVVSTISEDAASIFYFTVGSTQVQFQFTGYSEGHATLPEPTTMLLLGLGLVGLAGVRRKFKQ